MLFGGGTPALQIEYEETRRALSLQINSLVQGRDQLDVEYARYCAERS